jgi:DNA-binding SARP family transcriptional activator/Tfp pilus assembly protein PilF
MATTAATPLVLSRPTLEARLDESFGKRLTLLVAGAGYGKSTLMAQWTEDLRSAWYTATAEDTRLSSLASGIAGAIGPHVGSLGGEFVAALSGSGDELARAEILAARLCDALDSQLSHDLVLVLDDAQEVSSASSLRLVESLCRQAPETLHIVVASRHDLDLRVDRLRAQGQVMELSSSDFAFTLEEVDALSVALLGMDGEIAPAVHAATGGWPAAVRLALEALIVISSSDRQLALGRLKRPGSPLFAFLAHEVFERESLEVRELVRTVAPFESFSIELCEALGLAQPESAVTRLVKRGLFVQVREQDLALHALVRGFARTAWPWTDQEERALHLRAAAWLETRGRFEDALRELAAGGHESEIARLLDSRGAALLTSGGADTVVRLANALPAALRTAEIEKLVGEALVMRTDYVGAIAAFERAAAKRGGVDAGLAWRLGMAHHFKGDFAGAVESYSRAGTDRGRSPDHALLAAWSAGTHALYYRLEEARVLADKALGLADLCADDRAIAAANVSAGVVAGREGRHVDADAYLETALAAAVRCGDLLLQSRIRTNIASGLTERGFYLQALTQLEEAMELSANPGFTSGARTLTNRANTRVRLGLLDEAAADFHTIIELSRKTSNAEGGWGLVGLGDVHRERGNLSLARSAYEEGISRLERVTADGVAVGVTGLARVLVDDDPSEARRYAERAIREPAPTGAWPLNTLGWVALILGDREDAAEAAVAAARSARERDDRYALAESLEVAVFASGESVREVARLEEALVIWRALGSRIRIAECELALATLSVGVEAQARRDRAERRLRALGVRVSASAAAGLLRLVASPTPFAVSVQALGGFSVLRDGVPVPVSAWGSKKPRELLEILVCRRGRATPRELVMETLWPGVDPQALGNRLSVALSTLRSVLDPGKRFGAEHFVKGDRESISLDLSTVTVDVEVFLHEAEVGLALGAEGRIEEASDWLSQAESAYAGDVLEQDPYGEHGVSLREEARTTYITVAHALARDAAAAGRSDEALRYLLRILSREPYDESAHLNLVAELERSGRRGEARRAYRAYVARMEEIGATPAAFPTVT